MELCKDGGTLATAVERDYLAVVADYNLDDRVKASRLSGVIRSELLKAQALMQSMKKYYCGTTKKGSGSKGEMPNPLDIIDVKLFHSSSSHFYPLEYNSSALIQILAIISGSSSFDWDSVISSPTVSCY